MRAALILVVPAFSLLACGSPHAGNSCSSSGFVCQDTSTALECRASSWLALPCSGPGGCTVANSAVSCDMSGDKAGDACASTAEGKGLCAAGGTATLECRGGVLVQTNTCVSCAVSNNQVVCQQ